MIDNVVTGRKIAELRLSRGLTQQQLASILGVSHQAVSKWESGQALPDIQIMLMLTQFFGITIEQLITEREELPQQPEQTAQELRQDQTEQEQNEDACKDREVKVMNIQQLLQMAPFMSKEVVEEIALGLAEPLNAVQLARLAPYIRPECLEKLMEKHAPQLDWDTLRRLAPFMSREAVDTIARKIADGETTVRPAADPFNRTINDIGKAFDSVGREVGKTFDDIGKGMGKTFDDIGKGVDKAFRKAIRFGENVVSEVSRAFSAEDAQTSEHSDRSERAVAIRRRAFERAIADGRWDWIGDHIAEVDADAELKAQVAAAAKVLGMHDWICDHMGAYADDETIDAAIENQKWDWLGENAPLMDADAQQRVALAASAAANWEWLHQYSDTMNLADCAYALAHAALLAGESRLFAQLAKLHLPQCQLDALCEEAYNEGRLDALDETIDCVSPELLDRVLTGLAGQGDWNRCCSWAKHAGNELVERLMEAAVDQGNFDAIDLLDTLL